LHPELTRLQHVHGRHSRLADAVLCKLNFAADATRQVLGHRPEREVGLAVLGTAEVGHHDHAGAALREMLKRGSRGAHAGVVRDSAVRQRDVQVLAHQDALA